MSNSLSTHLPSDTTTPALNDPFNTLKLKDFLLSNLALLGYEQMTSIQKQSLPVMLEGHDVIAQAKTGSGKTAAFGLSILNCLDVERYAVQALILCPTRELAEQVSHAIRQLARLMPNVKVLNLSGGTSMRPQLDSLRHGAHIIVGTPGRVQKHLDKESLTLNRLKLLVLDEADRMLDMGFHNAIKNIIHNCPGKRQTLLFSATYPSEIEQIAHEFMINAVNIVDADNHSQLDIEQHYIEVNSSSYKAEVLKNILLHYQAVSTLIFCNTKDQTSKLSDYLTQQGFSCMALNGDMEQPERDLAVIYFTNQSCPILIATDVAARGLDIKELPLVINFDLAFEHDNHIHRIGRTGRAGSTGVALSITTPSDAERLCVIESHSTDSLSWKSIETFTINGSPLEAKMGTLILNGGKKDKIRAGDILGSLTKEAGIASEYIGKINISALNAYVAIDKSQITKAQLHLQNGRLKGKKISVRAKIF